MEGADDMDWREGKANFLFTSIFHRPSPPLGVFCCRPKYGSLNGTTGTIGALTFFAFLLFSFLSPPPRFRQYFSHLFWFFIPKDLDPNFFFILITFLFVPKAPKAPKA